MSESMSRAVYFPGILVISIFLGLSGCVKVGPDFVRPDSSVSSDWLEAGDKRISNQAADYRSWWRAFNDPVLDRLIDTAYRQNLSLRIAGVRVLEARAQLGVSIGSLYPQTQRAFGSYYFERVSEAGLFSGSFANPKYQQAEVGLTAAWEMDFWGKFRRGIQSADASWVATVADYDNALVSLTADVANSYVTIRTLEKRIEVARQNIETQIENLKIAQVRFDVGTTTQRDLEQAKTLLNDTKATVPPLQSQLRQAKNALSVLVGLPPDDLKELLAGTSDIPAPPPQIAVGIPADLIRRRPDIRSAEYQAAAQSAQIGVAKADLFPALTLNGTFGFLSTNIRGVKMSDIFRWDSREYTAGPSFSWNILNYGRITGNVRVQDARFQQLLMTYQNTVLQAQQEVEDAMAGYLRSEERAWFLAESAAAAGRSLELARAQYREGVADFTVVLVAQQALLTEQDNLASTVGSIASNMVAIYRALGGGWQIREGKDLVPDDVKEAMAKRTNWGRLLDPAVYIPAEADSGIPESRENKFLIRSPDW
jgi:NodT family efflux transporter outer membrane factor (OMF) lipoprotein